MPQLKPTRGICLNRNHPLSRGLIGLWLFNEGSGGQVFDLSRNGKMGIVNGCSWATCKFGPGMAFDGSGEVNFGNVTEFNSVSQLTWLAWVNIPEFGSGWDDVFRKYNSSTNGILLSINSNDIYLFVRNGANTYNTVTNGIVGGWHQWVMVFDGTLTGDTARLKLYIDGKDAGATSVAAGIPATTPTNTNDFLIGYNLISNCYIDHAIAWNSALSASEIAQLYREPFCMFEQEISPAYFFIPGGEVKELAGTVAISSTTSGEIKLDKKLVGIVAIESTCAGILKATKALLGVVTITSTVTGELIITGIIELAGSCAIESTIAGILRVNRGIAGISVISSTVAGELVSPSRLLAGDVAIASSVAGELVSPSRELSGTVAIASSIAGGILRTRGLSGAVVIASTCAAEIKRTVGLAGTVVIASSVSGEFYSPSIMLAGEVVISSTVIGELLSIAAGRTYFTYENGMFVFYVAGCEAMRIKSDGSVDVKGAVTGNAF